MKKWYVVICNFRSQNHHILVFSSIEEKVLKNSLQRATTLYVSSMVDKITPYEITSITQLNEDGTKEDLSSTLLVNNQINH